MGAPEYVLKVSYKMRGWSRRYESTFDTEANARAAAKLWEDDPTYITHEKHEVVDWWINRVELVAERSQSKEG